MGPHQAVPTVTACRKSGATSNRHNDTPPPHRRSHFEPSSRGQLRLSQPGDATDPGLLPQLTSAVDLVVTSPPYVRDSDEGELDPEVANHDPDLALYGGADGLSVIGPMAVTIRRLLRPGGVMAVEHDSTHSHELGVLLLDLGFDKVIDHFDHASRRHYTTAVLPA